MTDDELKEIEYRAEVGRFNPFERAVEADEHIHTLLAEVYRLRRIEAIFEHVRETDKLNAIADWEAGKQKEEAA